MQIKVYKINGHLKLEISMWIKVIDIYYTKASNFVVQNYGFDEDLLKILHSLKWAILSIKYF